MSAPPLEPLRPGEVVHELGRTSANAKGWLAAVAHVEIGHSTFTRIAVWSPVIQKWFRVDLDPRLVGEVVEILSQISGADAA